MANLSELSEAQPPIGLRQAWAGAKQRGVDHLSQDEINAEIAAHRAEAQQPADSNSRCFT